MNLLPFEADVMANPISSVRTDFMPFPAKLEVDQQGLLKLTNTATGKVVLAKPLEALHSVQFGLPEKIRRTPSDTVRIYVGLNEAYRISFATGNDVADSGIEMYEQMLQKNYADIKETFKSVIESGMSNEEMRAAVKDRTAKRESFIQIAQQAGVYKKYSRSFTSGSTIVILIALALLFLYTALKS